MHTGNSLSNASYMSPKEMQDIKLLKITAEQRYLNLHSNSILSEVKNI